MHRRIVMLASTLVLVAGCAEPECPVGTYQIRNVCRRLDAGAAQEGSTTQEDESGAVASGAELEAGATDAGTTDGEGGAEASHGEAGSLFDRDAAADAGDRLCDVGSESNAGTVAQNGCRDLCMEACDALATCTMVNGTPRCSCPPAYVTTDSGKTCAFDSSCSFLQCDSNATCSVSGATRTCTCRVGYTGPGTTCSNVDECSPTPPICGDHSTCADSPGSYTCGCQTNYRRVGTACVKNPCAPNPCANGGVCSESTSGTAVCACPTGYDGPTCAHNIDDCALNPCQNGGSCQDGLNARVCTCASGFSGPDCQAKICTGPISIRASDDLTTYRTCAEIRGNLLIGTAGLASITANDFPYLTKITGDLQISSAYSTSGTTTPSLTTITFGKLQTVEGQIFAGSTHSGSTQELRFPELTTIGAAADATRRFYLTLVPDLKVLDMPKLTTINGSIELRTLAKLCTVNLTSVTSVTGNVFLGAIPNAPASAFNTLRSTPARQGTLTESVVGCCSLGDRVSCESFTSTSACGC